VYSWCGCCLCVIDPGAHACKRVDYRCGPYPSRIHIRASENHVTSIEMPRNDLKGTASVRSEIILCSLARICPNTHKYTKECVARLGEGTVLCTLESELKREEDEPHVSVLERLR
jgi:hypothetical protein